MDMSLDQIIELKNNNKISSLPPSLEGRLGWADSNNSHSNGRIRSGRTSNNNGGGGGGRISNRRNNNNQLPYDRPSFASSSSASSSSAHPWDPSPSTTSSNTNTNANITYTEIEIEEEIEEDNDLNQEGFKIELTQLPKHVSEFDLEDICARLGSTTHPPYLILSDPFNTAHVFFKTQMHAEDAVKQLDGAEVPIDALDLNLGMSIVMARLVPRGEKRKRKVIRKVKVPFVEVEEENHTLDQQQQQQQQDINTITTSSTGGIFDRLGNKPASSGIYARLGPSAPGNTQSNSIFDRLGSGSETGPSAHRYSRPPRNKSEFGGASKSRRGGNLQDTLDAELDAYMNGSSSGATTNMNNSGGDLRRRLGSNQGVIDWDAPQNNEEVKGGYFMIGNGAPNGRSIVSYDDM